MATNIVRYNRPTPLTEAMEQLFRDAFAWPRLSGAAASGGTNGVGLGSNLYETSNGYVMQVLLPGVKADELELTANRNVLTIQGTTSIAAPEGARGIWVGLTGGQFREQFTLPGEVDADGAGAEYHDGILTLTLPKAEHLRVKTIKIGNGGSSAIKGESK